MVRREIAERPHDKVAIVEEITARIEADAERSSIFNPEDAAKYSSYIASYPMKIDLSLPLFSWTVHSREGRVVGVLDVDSERPAHFDEADRDGLVPIVALVYGAPGTAAASRA